MQIGNYNAPGYDSVIEPYVVERLTAPASSGGGEGSNNYNDLQNKPSINGVTLVGNKSSENLGIPTVNNGTLTLQKNGTNIGDFRANQSTNTTINITVPTKASDVSALPSSTKYAASLSLTINSSTYVITCQLKDQGGNNLGAAQTIDLPLESVVVGGSYDDENKKIILTLKNGDTVEFSVADLVSGLQTELSADNKLNPAYINYDSTHAAVTDDEKIAWSGKQDALTIGTNLDNTPIQDSSNPVTSGGVYTALGDKQDNLTFDGTYNASTNKAATVSTVTNAVEALDVTGDSNIAASKTIKSWSETDGKVSVTTQDISISASQAGLGNVTNDAQVKKISSSTSGDIVTWNAATGDTVADSGVSIETNTSFSASSDTKIPTSKAIAQNAAASTALKGYTADAGTAFQTLAATDNIVDAFEKVQGNTLLNKTNILSSLDADGQKNRLYFDGVYKTDAAGVIYTINPDMSITADVSGKTGTSTVILMIGNAYRNIASLCNGDYVLSGCPSGGGNDTYQIYAASGNYVRRDFGNGVELVSTSQTEMYVVIRIESGYTGGNITFKPMICDKSLWAISHKYEPYAMSNVELTNNVSTILDADGQKNVLNYKKFPSTTSYGITVTNNNDGTITLNGTATPPSSVPAVYITLDNAFKPKKGNYIIYCNGANTDNIYVYDDTAWTSKSQTPKYFDGDTTRIIYLRVLGGVTLSNLTLKPMICDQALWYTSQKVEPYAMSNVELTTNISLLWSTLIAIPNVSTLSWGSLTHAENVGTITINGTVGASAAFIGFPISLPAGTYKFSGCPSGGDTNTYYTSIRDSLGGTTYASETGSGGTFTLSASQTVWYNIRLGANYTATNLIFKPLIQV